MIVAIFLALWINKIHSGKKINKIKDLVTLK